MYDVAAPPARHHWNDDIPGFWTGLHRIDRINRSTFKNLRRSPGVYRLVALADSAKNNPQPISRLCGTDQTGTLYVGMEGVCFDSKGRFGQLIRSARDVHHGRRLFKRYNDEHYAGLRLRSHSILNTLFPPDKLAVEWRYVEDKLAASQAERELFDLYFHCFGDTPPLTFRMRKNP